MESLTNLKEIKALLQRHGFSFSKNLGQNFIINPGICPKIAEMGGAKKGCGIIEIGTGIGVLTKELALRAEKVVAIELDTRLLPILEETLSDYQNITLINDDVLKVDLHEVIKTHFMNMPVSVCANLPYYITSPILMRLLEERLPICSITVMVQKEAAQRLCAKPGTRECGAVTYACNYYAKVRKLFDVSRGSFFPVPNVDSAVIRLDTHKEPLFYVLNETFLFLCIRSAFSQRRKTLPNPLSSRLQIPKDTVRSALKHCGLSLNARAEQLSLENFVTLSNTLYPFFNKKS